MLSYALVLFVGLVAGPRGSAESITYSGLAAVLFYLLVYGITSVGTHTDRAAPVQDASGAWCATVTFTDLPLHTGEYCVSVFLFDSQGLVVYEEWKDCARFQHIFAQSTPGLVHLPHVWS